MRELYFYDERDEEGQLRVYQDTDMHLGMDNDAMDINDIRENILQSKPFHV